MSNDYTYSTEELEGIEAPRLTRVEVAKEIVNNIFTSPIRHFSMKDDGAGLVVSTYDRDIDEEEVAEAKSVAASHGYTLFIEEL